MKRTRFGKQKGITPNSNLDGRKRSGKGNSLYDPKFCELATDLMSKGLSICEVSAEIGVFRTTLHTWRVKYPEFDKAINNGAYLSEAWWQKQGRENIHNKHFHAILWMMNMTNRFGWRNSVKDDSIYDTGNRKLTPIVNVNLKMENDERTTTNILGILGEAGALPPNIEKADISKME